MKDHWYQTELALIRCIQIKKKFGLKVIQYVYILYEKKCDIIFIIANVISKF